MKWESKNIKLGQIKAGKKVEVVFKALEPLNIDYMSSSCGCSSPKQVDDKIIVTYTPGYVPIHLQHLGQYKTKKKITIYYKDNTSEVLSFSSIIKNK